MRKTGLLRQAGIWLQHTAAMVALLKQRAFRFVLNETEASQQMLAGLSFQSMFGCADALC